MVYYIMLKHTLIPSVQGGPFSNVNRMVDIDIPENHMCDLSQSFVQLECAVEPTGDMAGKIVNLCIRNPNNVDLTLMNVDLIKNCNLVSATKGKLEDIRRVNVLAHNLAEMTKSAAKKLSTVDSLYQIHANDSDILLSPFVEFHKLGSVPSAYINAHLRIPLSQLIQLGSMTAFDTSKLGRNRLHLELEDLNQFQVYQQILLDGNGDNSAVSLVAIDTFASGSVIVVTPTYDSLELSPWYVGQPIIATSVLIPDLIEPCKIMAINYDESSRKITLTVDVVFPALAEAANYTDIKIEEAKSATTTSNGTLTILGAQLGLCTVDGSKVQSPNELEYLTFTTEEYSVGNQSFMNKVFEIEPECVNTFLMFNNSFVLSSYNDLKSYRLRCDNIDLFDRDINLGYNAGDNSTTNDPSHYELLNKTFINADLQLKSLVGLNIRRNSIAPSTKYATDNNILMVCSPVPMTAMTKKFQVNLEADAATIGNVILYKQIIKTLKI